jgi:hypothetical protein
MRKLFVIVAVAFAAFCGEALAATGNEQAVLTVDQALLKAVADNDTSAVGPLTDAQFSLTDSDGKTYGRADVLRALPRVADQRQAAVKVYFYGPVALVRSNRDNVYALRIFVKRGQDWRALVYHQVTANPPPPSAAAPAAPAVAACENPCKTLPYKPRNAAESAMIRSWQELETAVSVGKGADWAPHAADEFFVVNNSRIQDKAARIAAVNRGGAAPAPLTSATMYDFGETIVMIAEHQPDSGKPYHVSRIWVKRDGVWQMAVSFQNTVQAAPAKSTIN